MRKYWQSYQSFSFSIWAYIIVLAMVGFGYFGIIGVLQNLYFLRLGYDVQSIGFIIASGQLVWAIFALPAALIGQRFGVKRALMLGLSMSMVAFALLYSVEFLPTRARLPWLVIWNGVTWVGAALIVVNSVPYLMGVTTLEQRGYAFATASAVLPLMAFTGGLIAGQLPELFSGVLGSTPDLPAPYRAALLLVPPCYALALAAIWKAQPARREQDSSLEPAAARAPLGILLLFFVIAALSSIGDGALQAFFSIYLDRGLGLPPAQIGMIIGAAALLPAVAALISAPIMKRFGAGLTFGFSTVGLSGFLVLLSVPGVLIAAIGRMASGIMVAFGSPARNLFSQEIVGARWRTVSSAVNTIGLALGWAIAAFVGGLIIRSAGFAGVFLFGAACTLAGGALTVGYVRWRSLRSEAIGQ
jgi:MFS family permease